LGIWQFIEELMTFQSGIDVSVRQLIEHGAGKKKTQKDNLDARRDICKRFSQFSLVSFLKEIAKTF
jgi:hypothetical protein